MQKSRAVTYLGVSPVWARVETIADNYPNLSRNRELDRLSVMEYGASLNMYLCETRATKDCKVSRSMARAEGRESRWLVLSAKPEVARPEASY